MKKAAKIISFIFHPVFFFLIMPYLIIYRQTGNSFFALKWTVFSSIFIVIAGVLILLGRVKGVFSDFDISKREERSKFYFIVYFLAIIYFVIALFFKGAFFPLSIIIFGLIVGVVIFDFVNRRVKASLHIGVASSFVISISILYGINAFFFVLLLVPLLIWSRLVLKKHTLKEEIAGGILGSIITLLTFEIGKYLYLR